MDYKLAARILSALCDAAETVDGHRTVAGLELAIEIATDVIAKREKYSGSLERWGNQMYVIRRVIRQDGDSVYVAPPGQASSYTDKLERAWTFDTEREAQEQCCGNETPVNVLDCVGTS